MLAENILRGIILLPSNRSVSIGYVVVTIVSLFEVEDSSQGI